MPNITNHQDNANQNHNEILSPHTCQNDYQSKSLQTTNVGKDVEKSEPSNIVKNSMEVSQKPKLELPYDPLLDIYPKIFSPGYISEKTKQKNPKALSQKDICNSVVIVLFIIAKIWKQCMCPSAGELIKKMWCVYMHMYIGILLSP